MFQTWHFCSWSIISISKYEGNVDDISIWTLEEVAEVLYWSGQIGSVDFRYLNWYIRRKVVTSESYHITLVIKIFFTTVEMRWYPRGIQKLVSTYKLPETWKGGGYSRPTQTQSAKTCLNFHWGGGGVLQTNIPEILEWGHSRNFEPKILVHHR